MQQYALTLDLKDDPQLIVEYEKYHKQVWPEVLAAIRHVGIQEMKIFPTPHVKLSEKRPAPLPILVGVCEP